MARPELALSFGSVASRTDVTSGRFAARSTGCGCAHNAVVPRFVTRLDDDLVHEVDRLVADGIVASRSAAVRLGLERLVRERRATIGRAIVAGYERVPQTEDELLWADEGTREMIEEEPW